MITSIEMTNFKCFDHLRLQLGKLTLLTGFNGGGKSSAIQPLLLLAQGMRNASAQRAFALNGSLVRLGTVGDVLPSDAEQSTMVFTLATDTNQVSWILDTRSAGRFLKVKQCQVKGLPVHSNYDFTDDGATVPEQITQSLANLTYLSAVREGRADTYPIPDSISEELEGVGTNGRFAPYLYDQSADNEVAEVRRHPGERASSVRKQLDFWIGSLFPGAQADVQMIKSASLLSLHFRLSSVGPWRSPANIGYGLTYVFPIIVALLTATVGQILVIDSPEAHLHPSAQSQMGRLLAHFAAAGIGIIVETHSDHLLNGARLAVKEVVLSPEELFIHFFTGASKDNHGVISPAVDVEGRVNEWPPGFFDQSEKDLSRLAGWA